MYQNAGLCILAPTFAKLSFLTHKVIFLDFLLCLLLHVLWMVHSIFSSVWFFIYRSYSGVMCLFLGLWTITYVKFYVLSSFLCFALINSFLSTSLAFFIQSSTSLYEYCWLVKNFFQFHLKFDVWFLLHLLLNIFFWLVSME